MPQAGFDLCPGFWEGFFPLVPEHAVGAQGAVEGRVAVSGHQKLVGVEKGLDPLVLARGVSLVGVAFQLVDGVGDFFALV